MQLRNRNALFLGICVGLYLSYSRKFANIVAKIAEDVQEKITAASIVKMIDVLLGEVVHTTIVSTQKVTDFLLDIRTIAAQIDTPNEQQG